MSAYTTTNAANASARRSGTNDRENGSARRSATTSDERDRASSTSFHAEITVSAPPRTPARQSIAITKLWSASPTTSTYSAHTGRRSVMRGRRRRASCRDSVHAPRKETATRTPSGRAGSSTSSNGITRSRARRGQPVHEREQRVHLEREPPVRRRDEDAACDAAELVHEPPLPVAAAGDVLDDRVREAEVERAVGERQLAPVGSNRVHLWERSDEAIELGVADGGDPVGPGIHRLEEVVARAAAERRIGHADVDDRRLAAPARAGRGTDGASARGFAATPATRPGAASAERTPRLGSWSAPSSARRGRTPCASRAGTRATRPGSSARARIGATIRVGDELERVHAVQRPGRHDRRRRRERRRRRARAVRARARRRPLGVPASGSRATRSSARASSSCAGCGRCGPARSRRRSSAPSPAS